MLLQFKFKNHKCFYDETILDLMATQEKRHLESTINVNGNNILPIIAIHGANASGKSSALETLDFMFNFVKYSNRMDINNDLPTIPFAFSEKSLNENSIYSHLNFSFSNIIGVTGFEPATSSSRTMRTTKLCYTPLHNEDNITTLSRIMQYLFYIFLNIFIRPSSAGGYVPILSAFCTRYRYVSGYTEVIPVHIRFFSEVLP